MKRWLKQNIGILYIVLLTGVLSAVLLRSDELPNMLKTLGSLQVRWVWAAAACILIYLALRALSLWFYLKSRGCQLRLYEALIITGIGQFYSAVTPSASGGQPMQVLAMHQRGIPLSIGTAAVSLKFIGFQTTFMLMGGLLWATHMHMVGNQLGGVRWLVLLGYLLNSVMIFLVLTAMNNRGLVDRVMDWLIRMAHGCGWRATRTRRAPGRPTC